MKAAKERVKPIGLLDSGLGGLTVAREIFRLLPAESIVYFGDTAHVPYGSRPEEELLGFARRIVEFLVGRGVKYIIFACNTSSSISLDIIKGEYFVPMIGVIKPGAREAVAATSSGCISLIATRATVESGAYERAIAELNPAVRVYSIATPKLVPLVEAGELNTPNTRRIVAEYLAPLKAVGTDTLILGCTHYPYLVHIIRDVVGPEVAIVDPAAATVREAAEEMNRLGLLNNPGGDYRCEYYVSGDPVTFKREAERFLGQKLPTVKHIMLEHQQHPSRRGGAGL